MTKIIVETSLLETRLTRSKTRQLRFMDEEDSNSVHFIEKARESEANVCVENMAEDEMLMGTTPAIYSVELSVMAQCRKVVMTG